MRLEYTAEEIIKHHLITEWRKEEGKPYEQINEVHKTFEEIKGIDDGYLDELMENFRCEGGESTGIKTDEQNYEVEVRAIKFSDGWIGWYHLHGGGKHSEPTLYPWLEKAFFLNVADEKEIITIERTFERSIKAKMPLSILQGEKYLG